MTQPEPLPTSYDWGFVVGRSISAMADTVADPDRFPEARGSNGRVTFTPHTRYKKELSAPTAFVQFEVITAKIENGNIVDAQGEDGIYLISGAYKVDFKIDSGSIPGFDILVTPDHTLENPLDLVTASPFVPEVGTPVTTAVIPAGAAENQIIAWRNGRLVWVNALVQAEDAAARAEAAAAQTEATVAGIDQVISEHVASSPDLKGDPGPDGRGIASISDPDADSRVTITFTDGSTATVQAIRGSDGADGTAVLQDTGDLNITELLPSGTITSGSVYLRRIGQCVSINLVDVRTSTASGFFAAGLPAGFSATYRDVRSGALAYVTEGRVRWVGLVGNGSTANFVGHTYMTADPWPPYLPGTPA